ncbi:hypothetical protein [Streptomyces sp. NBC_00328]|uniref:hypothetical protein n=1 Tax=Streptomyces sp. NBC_00328 TaxID=2903646 RepID=UPI002E289F11|nr:hypothetical protein [Streptomyces sp. NBC_00328]
MAVRTTDRWIAARIRKERWHAAAWALPGLALSAVAVGPSLYVPGKVATEAAFRDARPCAGAVPARDDGAGCLRTIRSTVLCALIAVPATILALRRDREPSPASPPGTEVTGPLGEPV